MTSKFGDLTQSKLDKFDVLNQAQETKVIQSLNIENSKLKEVEKLLSTSSKAIDENQYSDQLVADYMKQTTLQQSTKSAKNIELETEKNADSLVKNKGGFEPEI